MLIYGWWRWMSYDEFVKFRAILYKVLKKKKTYTSYPFVP